MRVRAESGAGLRQVGMSDQQAKPGTIWLCFACGATSKDRFASAPLCAKTSTLVEEKRLRYDGDGRVRKVRTV